MVETADVSGTRTFGVKVQDDAMAPLFGEGELVFVNSDLERQPGGYVIAHPFIHQPAVLRRRYATGFDDGGRQCAVHDQHA